MQAEHRHELEENDLANATMSVVDRIRPYVRPIGLAAVGAFAALAAWTVVTAQRSAEKEQAWDACLAAVSTRDGGRLGDVISRYPGSAAAQWSQLLLADNALAEGSRLVFTERDRGRERLQGAADLYGGLLGQKPPAAAVERAIFGLAKTREALGELEAARLGYQTLAAEHPQSPLRGLADARVAALSRPATAGWYDWFASRKPENNAAPAADATPATSGKPAADAAPVTEPAAK